jgi:putative tricarboxylic transport membrane protein
MGGFIENLAFGATIAFQPVSLLVIAVGIVVGIIGGALPGINAAITTSLVLPFTFTMPAPQAIMLLTGVYIGVQVGDTIPTILIGVPGTASTGATLIDGYPMMLQGRGGLALSVTLYASFIGQMISAIILIIVARPLAMAALNFGPAEYFALAILGLTMISGLAEENIPKAFMGGFFGMFLATVGRDEFMGLARFTLGNRQLAGGIFLIAAMMGLFALGMMMTEFYKPTRTEGKGPSEDALQTKVRPLSKDEFKEILPTTIGCGLLGTFLGILPGAGASIASFIAYSQAKQFSKNREQFGKGAVQGVAACESANSAVTGGAMVPMLGLGVPGSGTTAVILTALIIHGIRPGPQIFITNPEIPFSLFVAIPIGAVYILIFGYLCMNLFAQIVRLPQTMFNIAIVAFVLTGAYSVQRDMYHLYLVFALGIVGFLARRVKMPIPPIVLGLVLGGIAESNFRRALALSQGDWTTFFTRPISGSMLVFCVICLLFPLVRNYHFKKKLEKEAKEKAAS